MKYEQTIKAPSDPNFIFFLQYQADITAAREAAEDLMRILKAAKNQSYVKVFENLDQMKDFGGQIKEKYTTKENCGQKNTCNLAPTFKGRRRQV